MKTERRAENGKEKKGIWRALEEWAPLNPDFDGPD